MPVDLTTAMIGATVEVDQPLDNGVDEMATAFLVQAPGPDGAPRVVLVTAGHVFDDMPGPVARIGLRYANGDGTFRFARTAMPIRDQGKPLWRRHPQLDVAAMVVQATYIRETIELLDRPLGAEPGPTPPLAESPTP